MPRDGSGNYTLPAGNPVVSGTTIDIAWANPSMSDIAVQLNNVPTRDGKLGFTSQTKAFLGTATTPSYAFNGGVANSGLYGGISNVGLALGGVSAIDVISTQVSISKPISVSSLKVGTYTPVASVFDTVLNVTFPAAWDYFGVSSPTQTGVVTLTGDFAVETGGGPTGDFSFEITLPFVRLAGANVGGSGGIVSVSGGASIPEIAVAYAVTSGATTRLKIIGNTPGGFISGTGKTYRFSVAITYRTSVA